MQQNVSSDLEEDGLPHYHVYAGHRWFVFLQCEQCEWLTGSVLTTLDYLYDDPVKIQISKDSFVSQMELAQNLSINTIAISHDIHYQTAYNLTNYMLDYLKFLNYSTSVTVGECMGDPQENWYRRAEGAPPAADLVSVPQDGCVNRSSVW
jgi:hypothetical protein